MRYTFALAATILLANTLGASAFTIEREKKGQDWVIHCANREDYPWAGTDNIDDVADHARLLCYELKFRAKRITSNGLY